MVERLFMKDVGRAAALITIVNIAALVRAMIQLLMRRGVSRLGEDELPALGRGGSKLQRNVTADYFVEACQRCMIRYDPAIDQCRFFSGSDDRKASGFLALMGIPKSTLFSGGVRGRFSPIKSPLQKPRVRNDCEQRILAEFGKVQDPVAVEYQAELQIRPDVLERFRLLGEHFQSRIPVRQFQLLTIPGTFVEDRSAQDIVRIGQ